jgi:hypothetical protein
MKSLEAFNKRWEEQFKKERIRLLSSHDQSFVDFIKEARMKSVEIRDEGYHYVYDIEIVYQDQDYTFYIENEYYDQDEQILNEKAGELDAFVKFLEKIEFTTFAEEFEEEQKENEFQQAKKTQVGLKIVEVEKSPDFIIYILENGDRIRKKILE